MREINVHAPAQNGRPVSSGQKRQNSRAVAPLGKGATHGQALRPADSMDEKRKNPKQKRPVKKEPPPMRQRDVPLGTDKRQPRNRTGRQAETPVTPQSVPKRPSRPIPPAAGQRHGRNMPMRREPLPAAAPPQKKRPYKDVPPAQKRRITRAEARRGRLKKRIWTLLLVLLLIGVGIYVSVTLLFKIGKYEIQGECGYSLEELTEAFGHTQGESIFAFQTAEAEAQLAQKMPYLESVKVRRRLPDTVVFLVTPAAEKYCASAPEGFVILSEQFKILRTAAEAPAELCQLEGITAKSTVIGAAFQTQAQEQQTLLEALLPSLEKSGLTGVKQIDLSDSYHLWFTMNEGKLKVLLGTTVKLDYKLKTVYKILTDELAPGSEGTLDVTAVASTGKTIFKRDVIK